MDLKTYSGQIAVKAEAEGTVEAVFATLNLIDKDGDVTLPGAFGEQACKLAAWGHDWGELPVGRGATRESGNEAIFAGQFFLDTMRGMEHFKTVKNLAELQEWSYGFHVDDSEMGQFEGQDVRFLKKMTVFEVSPVMRGAGVDTRTLAMKGMKYTDQAAQVLADLRDLVTRSGSLADLRAGKGQPFPEQHRARLTELLAEMEKAGGDIKALLDATAPVDHEEMIRQAVRFQRILAGARRA